MLKNIVQLYNNSESKVAHIVQYLSYPGIPPHTIYY